MTDDRQAAHPVIIDEEYKEATKAVVDDRMRTDVLGPRMCAVLEQHTPASTVITKIIKDSVQKDPDVQKEIKSVIETYNKEQKVRWLDRGVGAVGAVFLAIIIWSLQNFLRK